MPELASRLAKLLKLACCMTAPEGERFAALGRLSAIAAANDVDGRAFDQEDLARVYWEGHARGVAETKQQLRPARDWTPTEGGSAEVADDAERLLDAAAKSRDADLLSDWEVQFSNDMRKRFERYGTRMYVSAKQWECLDRLEAKLRRQDFID
jgi:hypothetical protein